MLRKNFLTTLLLCVLLLPVVLRAQPLRVAVAANAQFVMTAISKAYRQRTGVQPELIISSSGKLTAQIQNGAPFDIFLSADTQYPEALHQKGFAQLPPRIYAYGTLVLWAGSPLKLDPQLQVLRQATVRKIAIANPQLAPYGEAAVAALRHAGLYETVQDKLVYGESIAQVNQYITTGAVTVGFTAKSVVLDPSAKGKGTWVELDPKSYQPIAQSVVLLKRKNAEARLEASLEARKFYDFLFTSAARAIFEQYGYRVTAQ